MAVLKLNSAVYTPELDDILKGSFVETTFSYELLDNLGQSKGFLDCVIEGGSVSNQYLAEIKRTCEFSIAETGNFDTINFNTDRVKIYCDIYDYNNDVWLRYPLGVFVMSAGSREANPGIITRNVEGYDLTQQLKRAKHTSTFVVSAGTNIVSTVRSLIESAGLTHYIIDSDETVTAERSYDAGSELIATINDLLNMINYRSLYFDANGIATSGQYISPADRIASQEYITDDTSLIADGANQTQDTFDVPNAVLVVVSQPDRPVITSYLENNNPLSPTSIINTGDTRVQVYSENEDVTTQAQADAKAVRYLTEISQIFETVEFSTAINPTHTENDIISLTHEDLEISTNYSETSWKISLKAGTTMSHSARRTVSV